MEKTAKMERQEQPSEGLILRHTLRGHEDVITDVAWSPDGKMIASTSMDQTVRIWDPLTGELLQLLEGRAPLFGLAWSPDSETLAVALDRANVQLRSVRSGTLLKTIEEQTGAYFVRTFEGTSSSYELLLKARVFGMAWSPDGEMLVEGNLSGQFQLWDADTGARRQRGKAPDSISEEVAVATLDSIIVGDVVYVGRDSVTVSYGQTPVLEMRPFAGLRDLKSVNSVAWAPDGQTFALAFGDSGVRVEDQGIEKRHEPFRHSSLVFGVAWSPDGTTIATSCLDGTVQLWEFETGQQTQVLEGHADAVTSVAFSADGQFLASKSLDESVRIWRCRDWEAVAVFHERTSRIWPGRLVFHPTAPVLATLGEEDTVIRLWDLDLDMLVNVAPIASSVHYANAKVILVGDTGVGKSGLALVLTGQSFQATDSTHGRHVWPFDRHGSVLEGGRTESHEILLWDLAGQPGYRLIHQLHLNEVTAALIVFDARSETDPFSGVRHWERALRQAQRIQGAAAPPMKNLLVAARTDRGGVGVSRSRIDALVKDLDFDGYIETSAKESWGITDLAQMIREAIDWDTLPKVSSTKLFKNIKDFLISEKETGCVLSTADELYRAFLKSEDALADSAELRAQVEVCIGRVESRGLIRRLSFGDLVLLQPELLDAYASAMVNAARDEPDGLGCIAEEDARAGRFRMPEQERITDEALEELLLIATVEDLLHHEIALREPADEGTYLVFPSQLTREHPDLPDPAGKAVTYHFEGPVLNVYSTLAVRLSHSGLFKKKEMWKNAAAYTTATDGTYGMYLRGIEGGRGELTLFFDQATSEEMRFHFEEYIHAHLQRRALPESLKRHRVIACTECGFIVTDQLVRLRAERGFDWADCPVCSTRVSLLEHLEPSEDIHESAIPKMEVLANVQRDRDTAASILQGKIATKDFDVFLCHNSEDKLAVKKIGEQLKELGILPWLDEWELRPGLPWQQTLEGQIKKIKSAAVFVGEQGLGPWQDAELNAFLRQFVKRELPVIPVVLPDCDEPPSLPVLLEGMTWVDFREEEPDPMQLLVWGITGAKPRHGSLPESPIE